MFNFFKKKTENKTSELVAISHGKLVDLDTVSDPIFAQKMMGDGYALVPNDGKLYSPVSGKVRTIFPTKHAIGITTETGIDVLIHLGFDTVELEGKPFDLNIQEGQTIVAGESIGNVDLSALTQADKDKTFVVVCTDMDQVGSMEINSPQTVEATQNVGYIKIK